MNIPLTMLIIFVSTGIGIYIDVYTKIELPPNIWWLFGCLTGIFSLYVGITV